MAKLYPRRQTVIIFIVCVIVVVLVAWYSRNEENIESGAKTVVLAPANLENIATTSISGDWQKQFFGVATTSIKLSAKKTVDNPETPLTLTDELGRDLFTQYMMANRAGLDSDPDVVNSITNRFINSVAVGAAKQSFYFSKDIRIIPDSGKNGLVEYGKNLMSALGNMPTEDAAIIANDAFKQGDMGLLKNINPIIVGYESVVNAMRVIPVPRSAAQYHIDLLNSISAALENSKALENTDRDPTRGLSALSSYVSDLQNISTSLNDIQNYFTSYGVIFSS